MKTCENCKKVFEDDMKYCPYCGNKYHDYQDDLKQAMAELFEEEKPIYSRVKRQELLKEEKTNQLLNRLLVLLVVLMIGTLLVGAVMIGEKFLPTQVGVVEDTNSTIENNSNKDEIVQNDESIADNKNDGEVIDITNIEDGDFFVEEVKVIQENNQIKLEVKCHTLISGNVFLKDNGNLNIGPIELKEGNNEFYFLVNGQTDYKLYFDADEKEYEYSITKDMIQSALKIGESN